MIEQKFNIYLHAGIAFAPVVHCSQYSQGETWTFTILDNDGSVYRPSSGALIGVKSDGNVIAGITGTVNSDGTVSIVTTQQLTAAAGKGVFELTIDGGTNGTANFIVDVEPKPTDGGVLSESDLSIIQQGINSVTPAVINETVSDYLEEHMTNPPIDPTLSISNAAADAKVTGDKITELKTAITAVYDGEHPYEYTGTNIEFNIPVTDYDKPKFTSYHSQLTYYANTTSFFIGAYDSNNTIISEIVREKENQSEKTVEYEIPTGTAYLRIVCHSTATATVRITTENLNLSEVNDKLDASMLKNVLFKENFEQGLWEANAKYDSNVRIRYPDRIHVKRGDIIYFSNDTDLYFNAGVYQNITDTTVSEASGWVRKYTFTSEGYVTIMVANATTYGHSTAITPSDLDANIEIISADVYAYALTDIGIIESDTKAGNDIDITYTVPVDGCYLFVGRSAITYGSSATSFAIIDTTGTSVDFLRERGSQPENTYIFKLSEGTETVRVVYHTTGTSGTINISFIETTSVLGKLLSDSLNAKNSKAFNDAFMISNNDSNTKSYVFNGDGAPMPFRYATANLGTGITIQDVQYTEEGTYIISSENDGVVFVDNSGNVTFKSVSDFGHGISIQKLSTGNFMVASVDSNYGTENANRNIYHYDYTINAVIDYFTPSISELLTFAWDFEDGTYLLIGQESGNLKNAHAYIYTQATDTAVLIKSFVLPSQYMQGGCVVGKRVYLSCNDGWNNIKDSYILVFDLSTFDLVNTITLSGMFIEVEGVSIYNKDGNVYIRTGETHLVRLFDIKM